MRPTAAHTALLAVLVLAAAAAAASPAPAPARRALAPGPAPPHARYTRSVPVPAPAPGHAPRPAPRRYAAPAPGPAAHYAPDPAPAAHYAPAPAPAAHYAPGPAPARPPMRPPLATIDAGYVERHYSADSSAAYRALAVAFEGENALMETLRAMNEYSWDDVLWLYEWHTPCARAARHGTRFVASEGHAYTHASEVLPGLWLGNACAAADPLWLADRQIGLVVNAATEWDQKLLPASWRGRVAYHKVQLEDRWLYTARQFLDDLDTAVAVLDAWRQEHPDGAVLVHCNLGVSRSTSVVLRYLQRVHGMRVGDALALVRRARPFARPNRKFQEALGLPPSDESAPQQERRELKRGLSP